MQCKRNDSTAGGKSAEGSAKGENKKERRRGEGAGTLRPLETREQAGVTRDNAARTMCRVMPRRRGVWGDCRANNAFLARKNPAKSTRVRLRDLVI